jgi:hypothetical protein
MVIEDGEMPYAMRPDMSASPITPAPMTATRFSELAIAKEYA